MLQVFIIGWSAGLQQVDNVEAVGAGRRSCSSVSIHLLLAGFRAVPCIEKSHEKSI